MRMAMARKPISAKMRFLILERDHFTCRCCGSAAPNVTLHVDHIIAVANGGSNDPTNLRAICITCNVGKGAMGENVTALPPAVNYPVRVSKNEVRLHFFGEKLTEPVLWVGEQWAVTAYGLECRDGTYPVEASRLWEADNGWTWEKHIGGKTWCNRGDLYRALDWARQHFANLKPVKHRAWPHPRSGTTR